MRRPITPYRATLRSYPDPEGAFIDHAEVERLIDEELGFPSLEAIIAANLRTDRALERGKPDDVSLLGESLGVA
jgi:hypothetical protein